MTEHETSTKAPDTAAIQHAALRARIGKEHGLSKSDAALFLTQTDETSMDAHAQLIAERLNQRALGNIAPREGNTPEPPRASPTREFVRQLFGRPE